jgi:hypothetical protein
VRGSIIAILAAAAIALGPASAQDVPRPVPRPDVSPPASAVMPAATRAAPAQTPAETGGNVFMLRGLMNVFSLGMDTLARKLRAKDIPVRVMNYTRWRDIAPGIVREYQDDQSVAPVVIIGHSLGADGAINMGNFLAENGVPVRLVVAFDGVHDGHTVSPGVEEVINYYKADGWGKLVEAEPGFKGKLINVDLSDRTEIDHLNIEKSPALHAEVVARLVDIFAQ